ncbi:MAG: sigma-70 family RNA polymerase sigma factor [Candidatus Scalindua rubra]|uniref:Sigma-70 family RNA polymerase sigma factor n=1 Tax=Candidatus Scalindua brodae TaxID=237368 RepID=A0A0B0EEW9_9BACT|nr:MAG: hypothetical protein SCABRO_02600 [Candidatus Scalindua brodae]MBZ0110080.1 sigma-70 family RNA polymerase sigma factor [Candidatus Scalindua rubra]
MKEPEEIINECFERNGEDVACKTCSLHGNKCKIMLPILYNKTRGINSKGVKVRSTLEGFPIEDIKDIVKESIFAIKNGIKKGKFRGTRDAQFIKWVERIIHNKRVDFLRKKGKAERIKPLEGIEASAQDCEPENIDDLIGFLKEKVGEGILNAEDIALIKALYEGNENGCTQSEMSEEMGLKPDAFKQRKCRLIKKLESSGFGKDTLSKILMSD